jgi:enoyl-CoA hydratase
MRRALIRDDDTVTGGDIALGLALHQHFNPPRQAINLVLLRGDHIRQVIHHADQMGYFFFQMLHVASVCGGVDTMAAHPGKGQDMTVTLERHDRIAVVSINRPQARNAVNPATAQALFDAFLALDADADMDVMILTGKDGAFCAGFDLKTAADGSAASWIEAVNIPADWTDPVTHPIPGPMGPSRLMLSKPVIAAIEGPAVAGGMELAAWCDLRVMAKGAVMGVYCRRWGVPLIDGGTFRLPRVVGQGRANDLILTGRPVDADEAYAMGLADRVVPQGQALAAALDLAHSLTRFPQGCMRADFLSARLPPAELAAALRREWASASMFAAEGRAGATRFSQGQGRSGRFDDL